MPATKGDPQSSGILNHNLQCPSAEHTELGTDIVTLGTGEARQVI